MVKLWRCEICGDPYIGNTPPDNCPFCGAHVKYIKEAKDADVNFDVELNQTDRENAARALEVEISNAEFYYCAAQNSEGESKQLFKALAKVEAEHASVWRKILKKPKTELSASNCSNQESENMKNAHQRETKAIEFYKKAAEEAKNQRVKEIFLVFVDVEEDHLQLSKERLEFKSVSTNEKKGD